MDLERISEKTGSKHRPPSLRLGDLRLAWLVTFLAVVRLKNRSVAAKELGLTQGAVTKQIHSLEDWSRMVLVWPDSAPVRLTSQGEAFVAVAEHTLEVLAKVRMPLVFGPPKPKAKISAKDLRPPPSVPKPSQA